MNQLSWILFLSDWALFSLLSVLHLSHPLFSCFPWCLLLPSPLFFVSLVLYHFHSIKQKLMVSHRGWDGREEGIKLIVFQLCAGYCGIWLTPPSKYKDFLFTNKKLRLREVCWEQMHMELTFLPVFSKLWVWSHIKYIILVRSQLCQDVTDLAKEKLWSPTYYEKLY